MRLAVFDIDGTLTLGDGLGTSCFFAALSALFGDAAVDTRLESYLESTDCGIAREAAQRALGREPEAAEIERFKQTYLSSLEREIAARQRPYRPNAGADAMLPLLASRAEWSVAIATGNWRRAARLKLRTAGIAAPAVAACSEDGVSRAGVLDFAIRAAAAHRGAGFDRVVYVGDQPWDVRAARELGVGFVGVGKGERGARLRCEGARTIEGFEDFEDFVAMLGDEAR